MKRLDDLSETTRLPTSRCPTCGAPSDAATGRSGAVPDPGDIGVCFYCSEVVTYDERYRMVLCTDETIRTHPEVVRVRAAIQMRHSAEETGASDG